MGEITLTSLEVSLNIINTPSSFKLDTHLPCGQHCWSNKFKKKKTEMFPCDSPSVNFNQVLSNPFATCNFPSLLLCLTSCS